MVVLPLIFFMKRGPGVELSYSRELSQWGIVLSRSCSSGELS